jgi:hypothetical protein
MRSRRPFVELCPQIRATPELFRELGRDTELTLTVQWRELGQETTVTVTVDRTTQRLGGCRHWFLCPRCFARRALLINPDASTEFVCCQCARAVHLCAYPTRYWLAMLSGHVPPPFRDHHGDLARRRRGVHRPRGVRRRAARLVERMGLAKFLRRLAWEASGPATIPPSPSSTSCDGLSTAQSSRFGWKETFPDDPGRDAHRPHRRRRPSQSPGVRSTDAARGAAARRRVADLERQRWVDDFTVLGAPRMDGRTADAPTMNRRDMDADDPFGEFDD